MRIPEETADRIKQAADILEVVGDFVSLVIGFGFGVSGTRMLEAFSCTCASMADTSKCK